ncbi:hypothetical protein DN356_05660 [Salmonella enterica subsp. enterica serovar Chester]|nr:hypothetical protein [Salmonella enterica subsp. enterica serovar Chester]EBV2646111.1 hypothetical protein [Salmonella enterica subsp. enterica serovar Chester]EBW4607306.1 hypothetical protein [Salmonella enterica subsp. enterica serovar Chester]
MLARLVTNPAGKLNLLIDSTYLLVKQIILQAGSLFLLLPKITILIVCVYYLFPLFPVIERFFLLQFYESFEFSKSETLVTDLYTLRLNK